MHVNLFKILFTVDVCVLDCSPPKDDAEEDPDVEATTEATP